MNPSFQLKCGSTCILVHDLKSLPWQVKPYFTLCLCQCKCILERILPDIEAVRSDESKNHETSWYQTQPLPFNPAHYQSCNILCAFLPVIYIWINAYRDNFSMIILYIGVFGQRHLEYKFCTLPAIKVQSDFLSISIYIRFIYRDLHSGITAHQGAYL